ncbi:MAG: class I SAM-dependent methyltransferase, partial [Miltoncostaeaceae bacterium]
MAVQHRDDIYTIGPPATEPHPGLVAFAEEHAGPTVLDVGCGTGAYTAALAALGRAATGIELNPEYFAAARARGVDARVFDAGSIPFEDDSFDTAILFEVIE